MDWQQMLTQAGPTTHSATPQATDSVANRLGRLTYERIPRPQPFFEASTSGHIAYGETVAAFLAGLPNAALQMAVRCLEIALQEQYQVVEQRESNDDLEGLIHWAEQHLAARATLFERFEALRQLAHRHRSVDEHELLAPLTTIRDVTALLMEFYPQTADPVLLRRECGLCGTGHVHPIPVREYYLGNVLSLQCDRSRTARPWMVDWL